MMSSPDISRATSAVDGSSASAQASAGGAASGPPVRSIASGASASGLPTSASGLPASASGLPASAGGLPRGDDPGGTAPNGRGQSGSANGLSSLDELYQQQLRGAAAEIAAAVAHAVGTPLNVISGRAELIRQDPANALAQVTRIEDQVRKMADGLRDFVEYLTSDVRSHRDVPASQVLAQACALLRPIADEQQVELAVEDQVAGSASASVDQRSLSNLVTLLSWALRCTAALHAPGQRKLELVASPLAAPGGSGGSGAVFELRVQGLPLPEHWRIERFEASSPSAESEAFRLVAVCAAIARGQGGKLQADALPAPGGAGSAASASPAATASPAASAGVRLRLLCRASAG